MVSRTQDTSSYLSIAWRGLAAASSGARRRSKTGRTGGTRRLACRALACYAIVISIRRITISVPAKVAALIKKAAGSAPVSAWVTGVVEERLEDAELERQWRAFYRDVRPSRDEVRRADAMFRRLTLRGRRKRAA